LHSVGSALHLTRWRFASALGFHRPGWLTEKLATADERVIPEFFGYRRHRVKRPAILLQVRVAALRQQWHQLIGLQHLAPPITGAISRNSRGFATEPAGTRALPTSQYQNFLISFST
jgi:hypothetical protein